MLGCSSLRLKHHRDKYGFKRRAKGRGGSWAYFARPLKNNSETNVGDRRTAWGFSSRPRLEQKRHRSFRLYQDEGVGAAWAERRAFASPGASRSEGARRSVHALYLRHPSFLFPFYPPFAISRRAERRRRSGGGGLSSHLHRSERTT